MAVHSLTDDHPGIEGRSSLRRKELDMYAVAAVNDGHDLLVTAHGYEQLRLELERLRADRHRMSERLRDARADGQLADNPTLFELLEEQAKLDWRIAVREGHIASAQIAAPAADGSAGIGCWVRVRDVASGQIDEYELVGAIQSDVGNGRVSVRAPVGRAVVGQRAGAIVQVETPSGSRALEIIQVRPSRAYTRKDAA
jgi:transcription elongation factor GreA